MTERHYSKDQLPELRLYVENQGDKFHPLSDQLLELFQASEETDSPELLEELLVTIGSYEAAPEDPYHSYHTGKMRELLVSVDEDEDW